MTSSAVPLTRDVRTTLQGSRSSPKDRLDWLDSSRGIGIILVVIGHSVGGLMASGAADEHPAFKIGFDAIYSFHMPLFFFLSGLFIHERLTGPSKKFVRHSLRRLMYPYFVWGLIQVSFIVAAGQLVTHPLNPHPMLFISILWAPPSQFWFLYALFIMQMLSLIYSRFFNMTAMLITASLVQFVPLFYNMTTLFDMVARYWIFYAIATVLAEQVKDGSLFSAVKWRFVPVMLGLWAFMAMIGVWGGGYLSLWNFPAALLGTFIVLKLCTYEPISSNPILQILGRHSMPIYLAHVLVVAGMRIAFTRLFHISDPHTILIVASVCGLALPCALYAVANKAGMARALALR